MIRNLNFVGRGEELKKIGEELEKNDLVIIHGVPGIGKTELAKKYAQDLKERRKQVRWINASSVKIADEYGKLARDLNINTDELTIEEMRNTVYKNLNTIKASIYLILDDIDDREELKRFLKNKPGNVKILITTRDERLLQDEGYKSIRLVGLKEEEALEYITRSLNVSDKEAKELVQGIVTDKHMGSRPISLCLAVRYLSWHLTKTVKEYLEIRKNYKGSEINPDIKAAINSLSDNARKTFKYCAYLDANNVPIEILRSVIKDDNKLNSSIDELRGVGLVSLRDRKSLTLHREAQDVARDESKDVGLMNELFDKINEFFPDCTEYDEESIKKARKLIGSATSLAEVVTAMRETSMIDNERALLLFVKLGIYYGNAIMDFKKSLTYYKDALIIAQELYLDNHPKVAASLNDMGEAYWRVGELEEALEYQQRALQMRQKLFTGNHPDVIISLNKVGIGYERLGNFKKELEYREKALQMQRVLYTGNHHDVAASLNDMGEAYWRVGELKEALECQQKALQMRQALYSGNHAEVAISLNNVGMAYGRLGNFKRELEYLEKALQMNKALHVGNHPYVATSLNSVGIAYQKLGDNNKALEYYKQAYSIAFKFFGGDSPDTVYYKKNIENLHPDFFDAKPQGFVELLFSEGCNSVGAECRTIIPKRGDFEAVTLQVKEKLQSGVFNKIQQNAAVGEWSKNILGYDWGVLGYIEDSYLKKELGSLNNEANLETAKMLCFEAINLGIMKSLNKPYHVAQEFTKANPELVKKIAVQHPEYFVDGSVIEACIREMSDDFSFKEHLHKYTGVKEFKAEKK